MIKFKPLECNYLAVNKTGQLDVTAGLFFRGHAVSGSPFQTEEIPQEGTETRRFRFRVAAEEIEKLGVTINDRLAVVFYENHEGRKTITPGWAQLGVEPEVTKSIWLRFREEIDSCLRDLVKQCGR